MRSPIAVMKSEWRHLKADPPGERFERQHDRAQERSKFLTAALAVLGVVMMAGGVLLLFIPGPGLPVMVLGLALIGTASRRVARGMDRAEPVVRRKWDGVKTWWKGRRGKTS